MFMINKESGYTLVELLLAVFVGSIVLAGAYASYSVVAAQYQRNAGISEIRDFAIPTIKILSRDIRMAGYKAVDSDIQSTYGDIVTPISITDVNAACCDSFYVVYDKAADERYRVTYFIAARSDPDRNALYMDIEQWDGDSWVMQTNDALVSDYVVDFQLEGASNNDSGDPTLVNYNIVFQSRSKTKTPNTFTKSEYGSGNNDSYVVTDNYLREEFDTSIRLRNLEDNN